MIRFVIVFLFFCFFVFFIFGTLRVSGSPYGLLFIQVIGSRLHDALSDTYGRNDA